VPGGDRQAAGMAVGTVLSRVTGLARTVALAWAVGVTALGDAYNTANTAPNMVFQLAAGGVLTSALVPVLVRHEDDPGRRQVVSTVFTATLAVGAAMALALAVAAPWVMDALTYGARARADHDDLVRVGTAWLRLFAPQVVLYAASVFAAGVLQARGRLTLAGAAPVATNLLTIAAAVAFVGAAGGRAPALAAVPGPAVALLGLGTTAAVGAMAGLHLWGARRCEPGVALSTRLRRPVLAEVARVGRWVVLYVVVNQLGYAVVVALAASVAGGVSAYQWAFTVMQLPYAVVAVSVYSAAAPGLARAAASAGGQVHALVARASRTTQSLLVPAAAGMALLADRLALSLVGRDGSALVAAGITGFAVSLVPFAAFQLLVRTSYGFQDARTPALVNLAVNGVNVVAALAGLAVAGSPASRVLALALAHAASYAAGTAVLGAVLRRRGALGLRALAPGGWRPLGASLVMAAVLGPAVAAAPAADSRLSGLVVTAGLAAAGVAAYAVAARALGVPGIAGLTARTRGPRR